MILPAEILKHRLWIRKRYTYRIIDYWIVLSLQIFSHIWSRDWSRSLEQRFSGAQYAKPKHRIRFTTKCGMECGDNWSKQRVPQIYRYSGSTLILNKNRFIQITRRYQHCRIPLLAFMYSRSSLRYGTGL